MKAIFVFHGNSGQRNIMKHLDYITKSLRKKFEIVDVYQPQSIETYKEKMIEFAKIYDAIIFSGGDGTFNLMVQALSEVEQKPIIGYIPNGTACDQARKFGISKNLKKCLSVIEEGYYEPIEVMKVNDTYSTYVLSKGKYVNASYACDRKLKKAFGVLGYVFWGIKQAFKPLKTMQIKIEANNQMICKPYKMIFISNSNSIAGKKIKDEKDKGEFHIYLIEKNLFRVAYFFVFGVKITVDNELMTEISTREAKITLLDASNYEWSNDGEKYIARELNIKYNDSKINVFMPRPKK